MDRLRAITAAMAATERDKGRHAAGSMFKPFITIARQAGAGGHTIMDKLVARLREVDPADPPWAGYDKDLVELVAQQDEVYRPLVESLEVETRSWLDELLAMMISDRNVNEFAAFRKTAETIEGLVQHGRAVIVGRGGVFITRHRPGGTHVHLVAPLEDRINHMAERKGLSHDEAAVEVDRVDRNRHQFYQRYFPNVVVAPESFSVTFNTAVSTDDDIVSAILPLVQGVQGKPIHLRPVGVGR